MKHIKNNSLTLLEILVVLAVIGIMTGLIAPGYFGARRRAIDEQALVMLSAIHAQMRQRGLAAGAFINNCNNACMNRPMDQGGLGLDIPNDASRHWDFNTDTTGAAPFCITATGTDGTANWHVTEANPVPQTGACP